VIEDGGDDPMRSLTPPQGGGDAPFSEKDREKVGGGTAGDEAMVSSPPPSEHGEDVTTIMNGLGDDFHVDNDELAYDDLSPLQKRTNKGKGPALSVSSGDEEFESLPAMLPGQNEAAEGSGSLPGELAAYSCQWSSGLP